MIEFGGGECSKLNVSHNSFSMFNMGSEHFCCEAFHLLLLASWAKRERREKKRQNHSVQISFILYLVVIVRYYDRLFYIYVYKYNIFFILFAEKCCQVGESNAKKHDGAGGGRRARQSHCAHRRRRFSLVFHSEANCLSLISIKAAAERNFVIRIHRIVFEFISVLRGCLPLDCRVLRAVYYMKVL